MEADDLGGEARISGAVADPERPEERREELLGVAVWWSAATIVHSGAPFLAISSARALVESVTSSNRQGAEMPTEVTAFAKPSAESPCPRSPPTSRGYGRRPVGPPGILPED